MGSLPGPSPCWPACWSQRSQSLRPTRRLLPSSFPSYQHWCDTHTPTHTQANTLPAAAGIYISSLRPCLSVQSESLHINPLHTLIPSTMCVSFGVMLPVGNPPNAIVFSYGHVQIKDMVRRAHTLLHLSGIPCGEMNPLLLQVKAGFGVNLIGVAVVMLAITTWGVPLFNLNEFPAWAVTRNVTGVL